MPADAYQHTRPRPHPAIVRLADYTPPPFLIDTVDLTFSLNEAATEVVARSVSPP